MVSFGDAVSGRGFAAPMRFEGDIFDCEVIGKIPTSLNGAFVRVGGDWFYPPKFPDDSPFNSDGYVSMFRFRNGIVDFKGRWVKTPRFLADRAAGRQLYGYYRNPYTDDPSVRDPSRPNLRTVSNTNTFAFAGKLFTLKEDGLPFEIDPNTMETVGTYDFGGQWKSQTFTAHPKIDPQTGEMIAFSYEASGLATNDIVFYFFDKAARLKRTVSFQAPYVSMVHDIAITPKHIVIPVYGYVTSKERLDAGKVHWGWDSKAPSYVGILPRDGEAKDIRWFKGPESSTVHTFNARTVGNKVIMEAPIGGSNPFPFFPSVDGSPFDPMGARCYLRRQTFDLDSKDDGFTDEVLDGTDMTGLGRIDDRYNGLDYRYAYCGFANREAAFDEARAGPGLRGRVTNSYGRWDLSTGKRTDFFAGDAHSLQEGAFAPKSPTAPEGDGYLLGVASNYRDLRSELVVVDAMSMQEVARVIMPFRLSQQVHGNWFAEDQLPFRG